MVREQAGPERVIELLVYLSEEFSLMCSRCVSSSFVELLTEVVFVHAVRNRSLATFSKEVCYVTNHGRVAGSLQLFESKCLLG